MVKVGHSNAVAKRIKQLQTGHPEHLVLLNVLPADEQLERFFHKRLAHVRRSGEWFQGPLVSEFLKEVAELGHNLREWYRDDGRVPDWRQFVKGAPRAKSKRQRPNDFTIRRVEPNPVMDPVKAAEMRASVRGLPRAAYLDAPNTVIHTRISPNSK